MAPAGADPQVSVVVPCYNLGQWLPEALQSCAEQSLRDIELLVVDDGSDDVATRELLERIEPSSIHVLRSQNRGPSAARNRGVEHSKAPYLCFLDADDRLHPTYLEKAVSLLREDEELCFVSCWIRAFGIEQWEYRPERCDLPTLLAECTVATPAVVRRADFERVGGFDENLPGHEDWDLWIRLVAGGARGTILPEILFDYRRRPGSLVDRWYYGEGHLELMEYLFNKHEVLYREHLDSVLAHQRQEIRALEASEQLLRILIEERLEPGIELRADLRDRLWESVAGLEVECRQKREELAAARHEIEALRNSLSWRITAPLRRFYELLGLDGRER